METERIRKQKINYLVEHFKKIVFSVVVIIIALGYFSLLKPKYEEIKAMKGGIENKETEEDVLRKKLKQMTALGDAYKSINPDDLKKIDTALPDSPLKDELLSQLEFLTSQHGFLLSSLHIEDLQKAGKGEKAEKEIAGIGKIKVKMTVTGTDYYGLKSVLSMLERNLRLFDVTSLKFSPESESVDLEMLTYHIK